MQIEELDEELSNGLPAFNRAVWGFPEKHGFLSWLFRDSPNTKVLVAHNSGVWAGALGVFIRPYLVAGNFVECGETYAWAVLPERKGKGLGIKLMKEMASYGRPLVALGGSADTLSIMPRMGFNVIGAAPALNLPLSPRLFNSKSRGQKSHNIKMILAKIGISLISPILRPRLSFNKDIQSIPITKLGKDVLDMPLKAGFQATYDVQYFDWLTTGNPELGNYVPFRFLREGRLVGWAFTRISEETPGQIVGRILEIKFSPDTKPHEHRAMVKAISLAFIGFGAIVLRAFSTCPDTIAALRYNKYMSKNSLPAMVHPGNVKLASEVVRMSALRADGGVLPVPWRARL